MRESATTTTATATPIFELKLLSSLLEHERMTATAEGTSLEGVLLLFVRIGVVAAVEAGAEFRVAEDLVGLVNGRHLLLCDLFRDSLLHGLVRVV